MSQHRDKDGKVSWQGEGYPDYIPKPKKLSAEEILKRRQNAVWRVRSEVTACYKEEFIGSGKETTVLTIGSCLPIYDDLSKHILAMAEKLTGESPSPFIKSLYMDGDVLEIQFKGKLDIENLLNRVPAPEEDSKDDS